MSAQDEATLSDAERAALAGLESKAEADDPRLAAQLRGRPRRSLPPLAVPPAVLRASHTILGPVLAVVGLVLTVLTLSVSVPVALLGALLLVVGLVMTSVLVSSEIEHRRTVLAPTPPTDRDQGNGPLSNL